MMQSNEEKFERQQSCWALFNERFPSDEDCLDELVKRRIEWMVHCPDCGNLNFEKQYFGRILLCLCCGLFLRTFVGTLFERMRRPRAWLAALWFLEHGVTISSSAFAKLMGIAQSTALVIFKKLSHVIKNTMENLPNAPFSHFESVICRRSTDTPRGMHPRAEENEMLHHAQAEEESNQSVLNSLEPIERIVYECLSETTQRNEDELLEMTGLEEFGQFSAALIMLEIKGLAKRLFPSNYVRVKPILLAATAKEKCRTDVRELFLGTVRSTFHGISRKCLQYYLAMFFWCFSARQHWNRGKLLKACFNSAPVRYSEILHYASPVKLRVPKRITVRA